MIQAAIILSVYNGSKYLREQLDSLINQTYTNFTIYIRDDESSDETLSIVSKYNQTRPDKVKLIEDQKGNLGVYTSFLTCLKYADADLYFFCDQDDIWKKNKLEKFILHFETFENPLLLISNYAIFKNSGEIIVENCFKKYGVTQQQVNKGIYQGFFPGCNMAFNSAAKNILLKFNISGLHDTQLAILSHLFGKIKLIDETLIAYRIHHENTIGLKRKTPFYIALKDFFKYCFNKEAYLKIVFADYWIMQKKAAQFFPSKLLIEKELFDLNQVRKLSLLERKYWLLRHFKPFTGDVYQGIVKLLLI
jgi:rhamnosyltransferase